MAVGTAGVRHVWAGAGLQHATYRGGGILRGFPQSLFVQSNSGDYLLTDIFPSVL